MAELATIPFARSLPNEWRVFSGSRLNLSVRTPSSVVLVKLGRRVDSSRVAEKLGVVLPTANQCITQQQCLWLWQGPREWLVLGETGEAAHLTEHLNNITADAVALVVEVTDRTLHLQITGSQAMELLAKGISLDTSLVSSGSCCRTRLANMHCTIARTGAGEGFELIADQAYGVYLHTWLMHAAQDLQAACAECQGAPPPFRSNEAITPLPGRGMRVMALAHGARSAMCRWLFTVRTHCGDRRSSLP